jgi:cytochrome c
MKRCLPILTMAVFLVCAQLAFSQEDMKTIPPDAFGSLTRPAATFAHDQHNEKAGLECKDCHHGGADGVKDVESTTEGTPCADCHAVQPAKGPTNLNRAYHQQCIRCHEEKGKGPLACGQCHIR